MRLTVPEVGASSVRKISTGAAAELTSKARRRRSLPATKIAFVVNGAKELEPKGNAEVATPLQLASAPAHHLDGAAARRVRHAARRAHHARAAGERDGVERPRRINGDVVERQPVAGRRP